MAGRPRKVIDISTGKIGKEAIKNRKIQEEKLKLGREQLKAPEWLRDEAKEKMQEILFKIIKKYTHGGDKKSFG